MKTNTVVPFVALIVMIGCGDHAPVGPASPVTPDFPLAPADELILRAARDNYQIGFLRSTINSPLVRITRTSGWPVSGVLITFHLKSGDGMLQATQAVTDAGGYASAGMWTLSSRPGTDSVIATVGGLPPVLLAALVVDPGNVTWYDLKSVVDCGVLQEGVANPCAGVDESLNRRDPPWDESIGLGENGYFRREIGKGSAFQSQGGLYSITGNRVQFTYSGYTWIYTRSEDRISELWCDGLGGPLHCEDWVYIKRGVR